MKTDILRFDILVKHYIGESIQEKVYEGQHGSFKIRSVIWSTLSHDGWSKWFQAFYYIVGEDQKYFNPERFSEMLEQRTHMVIN